MRCEHCGKHEATVHLTQVEEGQVRKLHLCETCAQSAGFDLQGPVSITDILMGLGGPATQPPPPEEAVEDPACTHCGLARTEFRKTGRLGCPGCYETFGEDLAPLLRAMHRGPTHVGKVPSRQGDRVRRDTRAAGLRLQLEEAVRSERYEEAALLRDRIRKVEDGSEPGEA